MKLYQSFVFLLMLMGFIWFILIMWSTIFRTFSQSNITSIDGNSTAPINPWSLVTTFLNTPSFLWLIPVFVVASIVIKMIRSNLSNDEGMGGYIPMVRGEEEEEEEEPIAQITPTGELQDLRCPKCSAPLSFRENRDLIKCGYCGSQVQRRIEEEE